MSIRSFEAYGVGFVPSSCWSGNNWEPVHVLSFSTGERSVAGAEDEPHSELWELNPISLVTAEFRQMSPIRSISFPLS